MRRVWVVLAGTIVLAVVMSGVGVSYAGTNSGRATASSCSDLINKFQKVSGSSQTPNFNKPKTLSTLFKRAAATFKSLGRNGPSALRSAFRHLATAYDRLSKVDFSNSTALSKLGDLRNYAADFTKIGQYFARKCKFTIPSSTTPST